MSIDMPRLALAFLTKDRVDLSVQTVERVVHPDIELFWMDGSATEEGRALAWESQWKRPTKVFTAVRGGPDAAIVFALETLLASSEATYVGVLENDVLLHPDWLGPTLALFTRGENDGLRVGAVSPRAYEDRILIQREGYAVMHNLGAGCIIFDRGAARVLIENYRNTYSLENRQVFSALTGLDIGRWWAFRGNAQWLTADWGFDKILAERGYCSLALVPTLCEDMLGQDPPLDKQGLALAREPVELLRNDTAFDRLVEHQDRQHDGRWHFPYSRVAVNQDNGSALYFPHQCGLLGLRFYGEWRLKWTQGFGPFTWVAAEPEAILLVDVAGPVDLLVGGGESGGQVEVFDTVSRYRCAPTLQPAGPSGNVLQLPVPASVSYRPVQLTARTAGVAWYGLQTRAPQPHTSWSFSFDQLPRPVD